MIIHTPRLLHTTSTHAHTQRDAGATTMMHLLSLAALAGSLLLLPTTDAFLAPASRLRSTPTVARRRAAAATKMALVAPEALQQATDLLLAYTDDSKTTLNSSIIGVSFIGAAAGLTAVFALLTKNLQSKSFAFTLSEEEQAAVDSVEAIFDPTEEDRALTEAGTQGFVRRKKLAEEAKLAYQKGKDARDVRDRTLYYAEVDLGFLATLLRAAQPQGGVFYDLGSGVGRACFAAGKLYRWKKVIGIEYLQGLTKEAQRYVGKYRGGSPVSFVNKDFITVDLGDADVVFLYATRYSPAEVEAALSTVPVGARVISLDRTLNQRRFRLIKTVEDPKGDLQLVKGYVYEKIAA